MTKFDARTTLAQTTIETIRKAGLPLLEPPIRICVDIIRAQMQRVPITALAPESTAAMDYARTGELSPSSSCDEATQSGPPASR